MPVAVSKSRPVSGMGWSPLFREAVSLPVSGMEGNYKGVSAGNCLTDAGALCQQELLFLHAETNISLYRCGCEMRGHNYTHTSSVCVLAQVHISVEAD